MRERRQQRHKQRAAVAEHPEILIQFCRQLFSFEAIFLFQH